MLHIISLLDSALGQSVMTGLRGNSGLCLQVESPELAACEGGSTEMATGDGISTEAATVEGASMSADDEATSQALERLESAGNAACCLNDTFEVCRVLTGLPAAQFTLACFTHQSAGHEGLSHANLPPSIASMLGQVVS